MCAQPKEAGRLQPNLLVPGFGLARNHRQLFSSYMHAYLTDWQKRDSKLRAASQEDSTAGQALRLCLEAAPRVPLQAALSCGSDGGGCRT